MATTRFDALARMASGASSRRQVLRRLAAVLLGGAPGLAAANGGSRRRRPAAPDRRGTPDVTSQVAGGTPAPPGVYPFAVAVHARTSRGGILCSGSLIDAAHVLTAAHCALDAATGAPLPPSAFALVVGQVEQPVSGCRACRPRVVQVAVDPSWTSRPAFAGLGDVAVLRLEAPVDPQVALPIALVGSGDARYDGAGQPVTLVGWGLTTTGGGPSTRLLAAALSLLDAGTCVAAYAGLEASVALCTGTQAGRAACPGDSGGPLFVRAASAPPGRDRFVQIGLVLGGGAGCPSGLPVVYVRLSEPAVNAFIQQAMAAPRNAHARRQGGTRTLASRS